MFDPAIVAHLTNTPSGYYANVEDHPVRVPFGFAFATSGSTESYCKPVVESVVEDVSRAFFEYRVRDWLSDTEHESSLSRITGHPRFSEIVDMEEVALKFILERMQAGEVHIHWFPALKRIAQHDPVPVEARGFIPAMARAWIEWGQDTGKV
jgi:hypothetical protein